MVDINYQAPNGLNVLKVALSVDDIMIENYLLEKLKDPLVEMYVYYLNVLRHKFSLKISFLGNLPALVFLRAFPLEAPLHLKKRYCIIVMNHNYSVLLN